MPRFLVLALVAVLTLTACDSNDPEDQTNADCASGSLTATADGSSFTARCIVFSLEGGNLSITGLTNPDGADGATQRQIQLTVIGAGEGTFTPPAPANLIYVRADSPSQNDIYTTIGLQGQIQITELSGSRIRGTFQFSGPESRGSTPTGRNVSVSSGQFEVQR